MSYVHSSNRSDWQTPIEVIDPARTVMGGIDLDPATTKSANNLVDAETYFTAKENGLAKKW